VVDDEGKNVEQDGNRDTTDASEIHRGFLTEKGHGVWPGS